MINTNKDAWALVDKMGLIDTGDVRCGCDGFMTHFSTDKGKHIISICTNEKCGIWEEQ